MNEPTSELLTPSQFEASEGVGAWAVISDGACTFFPTASFAQAVALVSAIAALPGVEDHQPHIDIRPDGVTVRLLTESAEWYGMSVRDVELAGAISAAAATLGLQGDRTQVQSLLIVPGALDIGPITPFWRAALGYEPRPDSPDEDIADPHARGTAVWFETMDEPRTEVPASGVGGGGAIHVAVWLPRELAKGRVEAALAAGGHLVRDVAPRWWTLADAAGNEVDIASVEGRD